MKCLVQYTSKNRKDKHRTANNPFRGWRKTTLGKKSERSRRSGKNKRTQVLRNVVDTIQIKVDYIRLKNNQQPASEEVQSMLEDEINTNDLTRFERFKKWARENLLALSTVAITAAGVITTIVVAGRKAIKTGAKATSKFAKSLGEVGKK